MKNVKGWNGPDYDRLKAHGKVICEFCGNDIIQEKHTLSCVYS